MICCGIDFASFTSVVASCARDSPLAISIETNDLGNPTTPAIVSFGRRQRFVGEAAEDRVNTDAQNTLTLGSGLITIEDLGEGQKRWPWRWRGNLSWDEKCNDLVVSISFNDKPWKLFGTHLMAYFLHSYVAYCCRSRALPKEDLSICVALPSSAKRERLELMRESAKLVGLRSVKFIPHDEALRNWWLSRNAKSVLSMMGDNIDTAVIGFFDLGFGHCDISFLKLLRMPPSEVDDTSAGGLSVGLLSRVTDGSVGTGDLVHRLVLYIAQKMEERGATVLMDCKIGWRLGIACTKLMKDLSGLPETSIEMEGILPNDADFRLSISRELFEELTLPCREKLQMLITRAVANAEVEFGQKFIGDEESTKFLGIEMVGGGSRIPFVQKLVSSSCCAAAVTPIEDDQQSSFIRKTLDGSSSVASGAALTATGVSWLPTLWPQEENAEEISSSTFLSEMEEAEKEFLAVEEAEKRRLNERNELESFILTTQNATKCQASLFGENKEKVVEELLGAEEWLNEQYSHDNTTANEFSTFRTTLTTTVHELCPEYFQHIEDEKNRKEREIEEMAKQQQQLNSNEEDKDFRALPYEQRIALASKNKEEGNELLKSGSLDLACLRYIKALQHLAKAQDDATKDKEEKNRLLLACNLNLSQVYLRLGSEISYRKAVASCTAALEICPESTKACYRRGLAYEKLRDFDASLKDLKMAAKLAPEEADIVKSVERVRTKIKAEELKAKKLYARMFSGKAD